MKEQKQPNETAIAGSDMLAVDFDDTLEPDIDYHLMRIKAIQSTAFSKKNGHIMAEVFLRRTGAINDNKGNYVINSQDIFAWFENLDYLRQYTEYDKM